MRCALQHFYGYRGIEKSPRIKSLDVYKKQTYTFRANPFHAAPPTVSRGRRLVPLLQEKRLRTKAINRKNLDPKKTINEIHVARRTRWECMEFGGSPRRAGRDKLLISGLNAAESLALICLDFSTCDWQVQNRGKANSKSRPITY
ncbi:hypothetical protein ACJJTC_016366 [Scirpophaga incertulas]